MTEKKNLIHDVIQSYPDHSHNLTLFKKRFIYRKRINDHNVYFFTKKSLQDDHHHLMSNDMLHNPSHIFRCHDTFIT